MNACVNGVVQPWGQACIVVEDVGYPLPASVSQCDHPSRGVSQTWWQLASILGNGKHVLIRLDLQAGS